MIIQNECLNLGVFFVPGCSRKKLLIMLFVHGSCICCMGSTKIYPYNIYNYIYILHPRLIFSKRDDFEGGHQHRQLVTCSTAVSSKVWWQYLLEIPGIIPTFIGMTPRSRCLMIIYYVINACCISHAYVKKPRVKATQGRRDFCVELLWIIVQLDLPSPVLQIDWIKALERAPQEMGCQTCFSSTSSEGGWKLIEHYKLYIYIYHDHDLSIFFPMSRGTRVWILKYQARISPAPKNRCP